MIAAVEEASIITYKSFRWPIFMGFCVLLSMLLLRNSTVFIQFTEIYWYLSPMFNELSYAKCRKFLAKISKEQSHGNDKYG